MQFGSAVPASEHSERPYKHPCTAPAPDLPMTLQRVPRLPPRCPTLRGIPRRPATRQSTPTPAAKACTRATTSRAPPSTVNGAAPTSRRRLQSAHVRRTRWGRVGIYRKWRLLVISASRVSTAVGYCIIIVCLQCYPFH